jgi:hypothetical protein
MKPEVEDPQEFFKSIAERLNSVGDFLKDIGNARDVELLLRATVGEDAKAFSALAARLPLPGDIWGLEKCIWIVEWIDILVEGPPLAIKVWGVPASRSGGLSFNDLIAIRRCKRAYPGVNTSIEKDGFGKEWEVIPQPSGLLDCLREEGIAKEITIYKKSIVISKSPEKPGRICI